MCIDRQPLAEVFGYPVTDRSDVAKRYRSSRLCPFNNNVPNCTKDKAKDPLGVCSINQDGQAVITCPIRFRQDWIVADDAAAFFFEPGTRWTSLTEVRLNDANGKCAGNIDLVLVAYDENGRVLDFGAVEVQAVYISGNVRDHFSIICKIRKPGARWIGLNNRITLVLTTSHRLGKDWYPNLCTRVGFCIVGKRRWR